MFILCSRGRPAGLARFAAAYRETGAALPLLVRLDQDDPRLGEYLTTVLPKSWHEEIGPRKPLAEIYNDVFRRFCREEFYGMLADDLVPATPRWDRQLVEAAGSHGVAYGDDGIQHELLATHPVIGGDLVRAVGWLTPPWLKFLWIDTTWTAIGRALGRLHYLPEVFMEHLHYSVGKSEHDQTYRDHHQYSLADQEAFRAWESTGAHGLIERLKEVR